MRDHGGRAGPARPPRRRWRPYLAALVGVLALTLAVAACGGGGGKSDGVASLGGATSTTSPGSGGSDPTQAALAYARCMRQHGVNMPDPKVDAAGRMAQQLPPGVDPDDPKVKAAQQACKQYLPGGGEPEKVDPQTQQQMLAFARCMREHGINIPDPKPGEGIDVDGANGVNPKDPKFKAAFRACEQRPLALPLGSRSGWIDRSNHGFGRDPPARQPTHRPGDLPSLVAARRRLPRCRDGRQQGPSPRLSSPETAPDHARHLAGTPPRPAPVQHLG